MPQPAREKLIFPIFLRTLTVLAVQDLSPGMRRVTLGGAQLGSFENAADGVVDAFRSEGVDDEIKLFFPYPGESVAVLPEQGDGVLKWPRSPIPLSRNYTVRRFDPARGELDVDFVRHGTGIATTWAVRCSPGDELTIAGPKKSHLLPASSDWILIAGDETALPAISRWLEELPAGVRAQVFIEVANDSHRLPLATSADAQITWLSREDAEPGTTTLLFDALRAAPWWDGDAFAWVGGETLTLVPIRRWLRNERGLPKENVEVTGYWRRAEVKTLESDPSLPDTAEAEDAEDQLHELTELVPAFAIRVAVTIGAIGVLSDGRASLAELAKRTNTDLDALGRLLRLLRELDVVVEPEPGRFELGPIGRELDDDEVAERLNLEGIHGLRDLALVGLLHSVRTGEPGYGTIFGVDAVDQVRRNPMLSAERDEFDAAQAGLVAPALAREPQVGGYRSLTAMGPGAGTFAGALIAAWPRLRVTVVSDTAEPADRGTLTHAFLLTQALAHRSDAEASALLARAARSIEADGVVLVLEGALDESTADEHAFEEDLLRLSSTGGRVRNTAELEALFVRAGFAVTERRTVGWGVQFFTLSAIT